MASQFEMQTGESIQLFLDKDAVKWGENWRDEMDEGLGSIAFFIPVLTPRYFMSPECRRELRFFADRATSLGIKELVLPLLYVPVDSLHDDTSSDDLVALVKTFLWEDWLDLRFAEVASEGYRRGVFRLATRLVEANRQADQADIAANVRKLEGSPEDEADESPGLLDRLADMEAAFPEWQLTLESMGREIELVGEIMREATANIERGDSRGKGFAARLAVTRALSEKLREPAERIWACGNDFASQLHRVDEGVRLIIERVPSEIQENPDSKSEACSFFQSMRELSASADEGLSSTQEMIDGIAPIEAMSRDLRVPLRRLREGLTMMLEAREVTDEWVHSIDDAGVDCDDMPATGLAE